MEHIIKVNDDNILLTQNEFSILLEAYEELKGKGEKVLTDYINYTRQSNSIKNLIASGDIKEL